MAMENHAGDMHSLEVKSLVEMAGPDFVGVNLDAGNAVWTFETPLENLENLVHIFVCNSRQFRELSYKLLCRIRNFSIWRFHGGRIFATLCVPNAGVKDFILGASVKLGRWHQELSRI